MKKKPLFLLVTGMFGVIALFICFNSIIHNGKKVVPKKVEKTSDDFIGVYEYVYDPNSEDEDLVENHYIKIQSRDGKLKGWYYGVSDDFDEGREGYYPGFFVKEMDDLKMTDQNIAFTLEVSDADMVRKPVRLQYNSRAELSPIEYKKWGGDRKYPRKKYSGLIKSEQLFFNVNGEQRIFIKRDASKFIRP